MGSGKNRKSIFREQITKGLKRGLVKKRSHRRMESHK
jgi:hypothetical protein